MTYKHKETKTYRVRQLKEERTRIFLEMDHSRMDYLTSVVCEIFKVKVDGIRGRVNFREYVEARQTIMVLALNEKFPQWYIGAYLGWRDHSTVIHGRVTVEGTLMKEREYYLKFDRVKNIIDNEVKIKEETEKTIQDLNTFQ